MFSDWNPPGRQEAARGPGAESGIVSEEGRRGLIQSINQFCTKKKEKMEMDTRDRDLEEALVVEQRPPQLDLYEPLLVDKETKALVAANGNAHFLQENAAGNGSKHLAMIGAKVSPIESLDYE